MRVNCKTHKSRVTCYFLLCQIIVRLVPVVWMVELALKLVQYLSCYHLHCFLEQLLLQMCAASMLA